MSGDDDAGDATTRDLLRAAGRIEDEPPSDIARDAVARLRAGRRGAGSMNEFLRIVHHFFRELSTILGSPPPDDVRSDRRRG
ncbi:MAG: hypothetical protein IAI48_10125 [Candidatus Eremiobacteraeota bacterium]|nr:hypothetical protein [Candidatus Eremiobacteraeota bacterium]